MEEKKFFIIGVTVDDGPTGYPEEYPVKCGPFTKEKADAVLSLMENEQWISGCSVYFGLRIVEEV